MSWSFLHQLHSAWPCIGWTGLTAPAIGVPVCPMTRLTRAFRTSPLPPLIWRLRQGYLGLLKPFRLGVRTLVTNPAGQVLLVRHSYRPGWFFPGGGVQKWETLAEAAIREAAEEGGVRITQLDRLFGVYANFGIGYCDHVALFLASEWQEASQDSLEIEEFCFFDLDCIPSDTSEPTKRRLAEVFQGQPIVEIW